MATNKREPYFCSIGSGVFFSFQVDKDIYNSATAPVLGLTQTEPPANSKVIPLDRKTAIRTGLVGLVRATVEKGDGDARKTRRLSLVCDLEKLGTAKVQLKGKNVTLGTTAAATASPWTFI
jgi:hypothetical protein